MAIYLTLNGKKSVEESIQKLGLELENVRKEKNDAYNLSGDTWHDNPGFNRLEQIEHQIVQQLSEKKQLLAGATVLEIKERNISKIILGSIVSLKITVQKTNQTDEQFWEIVGFGESDPPNKKIAYNTPLAKILMDMKPGEKKVIQDKNKGTVTYEVTGLYKDWDNITREEN